MKKLRLLLNFLPLLLFGIIAQGCSKEEDKGNPGVSSFELTSLDVRCSYTTPVNVNAPFSGKDYKLTVTATDDVVWSVEVVSGDLVTVNPVGEQKGNGEITISVAPNPDKTPGKKSEIQIKNSYNNDVYRFIFEQIEKELLIPQYTMIGQNDPALFEDENSKFNKHYMRESDNVALFWEKSFGTNPQTASRPFNPDDLLNLAEEVYSFMKYSLYFCNVSGSVTDKYKMLVYVINDSEGGATGGGNYPVGELAIRPHHASNPNMVYHEVSHSFQYMSLWDGPKNIWMHTGPFEMTSQWTLLRRSPNWIDQEYNHFEFYVNNSHFSLGSTKLQYQNPYMFEYWANKHGVEIISRIWLEGTEEDKEEGGQLDFTKIYKRITHLTTEQFNEEIYDAAAHFMTWDIPTIDKAYAARGANAHTCELKKIGVTYRITPERCPSNYGYNGIKLTVPAAGKEVKVKFKGIVSGNEYEITKPELAQWRYGFVAVLKDGSRVYGDPCKEDVGEASIKIPENTEYLWLVVAATPKEHFDIGGTNQWPYQFTLENAEPDKSKCTVIE